jgi:hypothetical protein
MKESSGNGAILSMGTLRGELGGRAVRGTQREGSFTRSLEGYIKGRLWR